MGAYVTLHATSLGKRLANGTGRTLYLYTGDGFKVTNCTGPCAQTWPPLMATGAVAAAAGGAVTIWYQRARGNRLVMIGLSAAATLAGLLLIYVYWHANADADPANQWLRRQLLRTLRERDPR